MDKALAVMNIMALVLIPVLVVLMGQFLQDRAEKRKDKQRIFQTLMTARIYGWTKESVEAQNIIDIVFADDLNVRKAWKDLYDKLCVTNADPQHLEKIRRAQYKLLEEMANSLGYKDKITWETIQSVYVPQEMARQMQAQANYNNNLSEMAENMKKMMAGNDEDITKNAD